MTNMAIEKQLFNAIMSDYPAESLPVVAGGYVRDLYFNLTPKDMDVFLWNTHPNVKGTPHIDDFLIKYRDEIVGVTRRKLDEDRYDDVFGPLITEVLTVYGLLPMPVQFIKLKMNPITFVLDHFDFTINKCWFNMWAAEFTYSQGFVDAVKRKTLTFNASLSPAPLAAIGMSIKHRLPRLRAKFPDWEVEII